MASAGAAREEGYGDTLCPSSLSHEHSAALQKSRAWRCRPGFKVVASPRGRGTHAR